MRLNFVIVMLVSWWLLRESLSVGKIVGAALIVIGRVVSACG